MSVELLPQERLLQVVLGGIVASGSSLSSSNLGSGVEDFSGGAVAERVSVAAFAIVGWLIAGSFAIAMGFRRGASSSTFVSFVAGAGLSSTVECLPVVHGGMARNSSKVRTRGLQHFQPVERVS